MTDDSEFGKYIWFQAKRRQRGGSANSLGHYAGKWRVDTHTHTHTQRVRERAERVASD